MSAEVAPHVEVWNRSTTGVPYSDRAGDAALAHALLFEGYAGGGSVLSAIESEIEEGRVGEGRAGFVWFGLEQVVAVIDEALRDYCALEDSGLEGEEHDERYDAIDVAASDRYAELQVDDQLTAAVELAMADRPGEFAPVTGREVEPRIDEIDEIDAAEGSDGAVADPGAGSPGAPA